MLYGTTGCHLCELAQHVLLEFVAKGWQVELVDIADDDALFDRFSLSIPVLEHSASGKLLRWPFDVASLHVFLSGEPG